MVGFYIEAKDWGTVLGALPVPTLIFAMILEFREVDNEEDEIFICGEEERMARWLDKLKPNTRLYLFKHSWDWGWFEEPDDDDDDDPDDGEPAPPPLLRVAA